MEELEPTTFSTHWQNNPASDPKTVLLRRLFFINEDQTKFASVSFYPARDYLPLVELGLSGEAMNPKTSFSATKKWTQWRRPCPCYGKPSIVAKHLLGSHV